MFADIKQFFVDFIQPEISASGSQQERGVQLATAALLMEMVRADFDEAGEERALAHGLLATHFQLSEQETGELLALGDQEAQTASSLFEFTQLIDKAFGYDQKVAVVEMLWRVAYQDGRLDKYEEYLMRKVADLIHVSHAQLIQAKHRVQGSTNN